MHRVPLRCRLAPTAVLLGLLVPAAAHAADGDLDPAFGTGGTVVGTQPGGVRDVVVGPDGRVIAGVSDFDTNSLTVIVRGTDGRRDASFSGDGIVRITAPAGQIDDIGVDVQPDGKILTAFPETKQGGTATSLRIDRFLPSGERDPGFGKSGVVRDFPIPADAGSTTIVTDLDVLPDGRFLIAGELQLADATSRVLVRRYSADGVPEASYGEDGTFGGQLASDTYTSALATLPDGSAALLASGTQMGECLVARITPAGEPDEAFGEGDGIANPAFSSADGPIARCTDIALTADGGVAAGATTVDGDLIITDEAQIARLTPAGTADTAFGGDGRVTVGTKGSNLGALTFQPDGKLAVVTGTPSADGMDSTARVRRLTRAGAPDAAFGSSGSRVVDPGPDPTYLSAITWDPAGRLLAGGTQQDYDTLESREQVSRVLADSAPVAAIAGPDTALVGAPVTFDAGGSTDPGGAVTGYAWDLDGDGAFDDATTPTATRTFGAAGTPQVAVQIRDANGLTGVASKVVTVTTPITRPPQTIPTPPVPPKTGTTGKAGRAKVVAKKLRFDKKGVVKVPVACAAGGGACTGKVQFKSGKRKLSDARRFTVPAGAKKRVSVTLEKRARKAIRRRGAKGKKVTLVVGKTKQTLTLARN